MAPTSKEKEEQKKMALDSFPHLQKVPADPCTSGIHPKMNQCISFTYGPETFQSATSALRLKASELSVSPLKAEFRFLTVLQLPWI